MMTKFLAASATLAAETQELGGPFSLERWQYIIQVSLMGMGAIFAVLILLLLVLLLFKAVFGRGGKSVKKEVKITHDEPIVAHTPHAYTPTAPVVATSDTQNDELTVALITAAIAAYRASEGSDPTTANGFRVVSYRRVGGGRAWNSRK